MRRGDIAFCGRNALGLITEDAPQQVRYGNGLTRLAYIGIHLTDKIAPIGSPWSSRIPRLVGSTDDYLERTTP